MSLIAVVGDIHGWIPLALDALERLEKEVGEPVAQVFAVGDVGLFLKKEDWQFLTGPSKHKHPETSPASAAAWNARRWPFAMIGGNHEPYHWLRVWRRGEGGEGFTYTDAGEVEHSVKGMRVCGLSGIYRPEQSDTNRVPWPELAAQVVKGGVSPKLLTYYKRAEVDRVAALPKRPHLLLTHDWPVAPESITDLHERPERRLVERLLPQFVCCGHHHTPAEFRIGETACFALNIIGREPDRRRILPGWAGLFDWDGSDLAWRGFWPALPKR